MTKIITHWKLIAALLLVFVSGLLCGSLGTLGVMKRLVAQTRNNEAFSELWLKRLDSKLSLRPEQRSSIESTIRTAVGKIQENRRQSLLETQDTLKTADNEIMGQLTPEQQKAYESLKTQRAQRLKRFLNR